MGILIKDMEMPKEGYVDVRIFADGRATTQTSERPFYREMPSVEVPEHRDLIDREALKDEVTHGEMIFDKATESEILFLVNNAPTVIPASDEET